MTLRIKEARERIGISQKELAESLNIKQTTFNGYETGAHDPKSNVLLLIAKKCNTTIDFLLGLSDNPEVPNHIDDYISETDKKHLEKYNRLDRHGKRTVNAVIDTELLRIKETSTSTSHKNIIPIRKHKTLYYDMPVSAGTGNPLEDEYPEEIELTEKPPKGTDFIVRVAGDSMEPTYHNKDKLFVKEQPNVEIGEIGIFIINGNAYVKEFGGDRLISHNEAFPDIPFSEFNTIKCCGKVLGICEEEF